MADRASDALDVAEAGLLDHPGDYALTLLVGRARFALGQLLEAQATLLQAAKLGDQQEPFRWLGEVLMARGDTERAVRVLERAQQAAPEDQVIAALLRRAKGGPSPAPTPAAPTPAAPTPASPPSRPIPARPVPPKAGLPARPLPSRPLPARPAPPPPAPPPPASPPPAPPPATPSGPLDDDDNPFASDEVTRVADVPIVPQAIRPEAKPRPPFSPGISRGVGIPTPPIAPSIDDEFKPKGRRVEATSPFEVVDDPAVPVASPTTFESPTKATVLPKEPAGGPPGGSADSRPSAAPRAAFGSSPGALGGEAPSALRRASASASAFGVPDLDAPGLDGPSGREEPAWAAEGSSDPSATSPGGFEAPTRAGSAEQARRASQAPEADLFDSFADDDVGHGADVVEDAPGAPAPDLALGEAFGSPEDVDQVLAMLKREGIFEDPAAASAGWATKKESRPERTRMGPAAALVWLLAIGGVVGGYFGVQAYFESQRTEAHRLVEQAREDARAGGHSRLLDAERHLVEARDLDAHDPANPELRLFVALQRALEDGVLELGFVQPALQRVEPIDESAPLVRVARAVVTLGRGDREAARTGTAEAVAAAADDAFVLYVAGRIETLLGGDEAAGHLERALELDPQLVAASLALAELRHEARDDEGALALLDGVLERDPSALRPRLLRAYLRADEGDTEEQLTALRALDEEMEHGGATDIVLQALTRARLERRAGRREEAVAALEAASRANVDDPRLVALIARAMHAEGRLGEAQALAEVALRGRPTDRGTRELLAELHLERRNGRRALEVLANLPADDPNVVSMLARAALLVGTDAALTAASTALDAFIEAHPDASADTRALQIRLGLLTLPEDATEATQRIRRLLESARALARQNPGHPLAALALGEAALRARDFAAATRALETVVAASPDDPEGHYLLGRARRATGDVAGARASFERAVALRPEHLDAKLALAEILLDAGEYETAEAAFGEILSNGSNAIALRARLGRAEALIGLDRLGDARVQLEGVRAEDRELASVRLVLAELALADRQYGDAIQGLAPIASAEGADARSVALYGEALRGVGETEAAIEAFDRAIALDAASPEALIGRADLYVRGGRSRDAKGLLDRARMSLETRVRPPALRARMLLLYGRVALDERRASDARDALREASTTTGAPAEVFFWLGEALASSNAAQAREAYQRYLDSGRVDDALAARARRAMSR